LSEACPDTRDAGSNSSVGSGFTKLAISWIVLSSLEAVPSSRQTLHRQSRSVSLRLVHRFNVDRKEEKKKKKKKKKRRRRKENVGRRKIAVSA
jgi:hypothetical protein